MRRGLLYFVRALPLPLPLLLPPLPLPLLPPLLLQHWL